MNEEHPIIIPLKTLLAQYECEKVAWGLLEAMEQLTGWRKERCANYIRSCLAIAEKYGETESSQELLDKAKAGEL